MPATIYFGAPVRENQSAHKEATDQGLNLLRAAPSEVTATVFKTYVQPGHTIFANNLASFIFLSQNPKSSLSSRNPIYHPLTSKTTCPTKQNPVIVFSFQQSMNSDQIAEVAMETGSLESRAGKNKLVFRHQIGDQAKLKKIGELRPKPSYVTPTGTTELNLAGYRVYLFLHRLFDAFMRCNQYPGFKTNDIADVGTFENYSLIAPEDKGKIDTVTIGSDKITL
jgi:hypothetical protein